ncbi:type I polyketide synthase [Amycolatopsis lexingtonensis]|uniref:type I polyketide synthase n=1 Tax=Amycolatopsis lexingtonensis TaxID=218822 RepID=UPI001B808EE8|nr:type I polyketide synthase [Amycolatopsis lexingtonensis]
MSHAFHSPLMDPMLPAFRDVVTRLRFAAPVIPLVTEGDVTDPEYWVRHVRETVRFGDALDRLAESGVSLFVEVGPDAALTPLVEPADDRVIVPLARRGRSEEDSAAIALGTLFTAGVNPDWAAWFAGTGACRAELPTYPFEHERFWPEVVTSGPADDGFWASVDRADTAGLAEQLAVDPAALDAVLPALATWRRKQAEAAAADDLRYRITWQPVTVAESKPANIVVVPGDDVEWADRVTEALGAGRDLADADVVVSLRETVAGTRELLAEVDVPVWCVTRGAVAVTPAERVDGPAALWGFGRVAALHDPQRWGGLVDVPAELDTRTAARLRAVLGGDEDQVAVRAAGVYGRRLTRAATGGERWEPRGTVLVTGDGPAALLADQLTGVDVVRDPAALASPPDAVIHSGSLEEARQYAEWPLEAFVLLTSVAGVWGVRGRGDEAAEAAELEAFARQRRDRGEPASVVAFSAWAGTGEDEAHLRDSGLPVLDPAAATAALLAAVRSADLTTVVADVRWERFGPAFTAARPSPLLSPLFTPAPATGPGLRDLAPGERSDAVLDLVRTAAATVLRHTGTDRIEPDRAFAALGFDSLTAMDLRTALSAETGLRLPATLVFDHPTPRELTAFLLAELFGEEEEATEVAPAALGDDPVVIVGMSCRYPGGIASPEDLWQAVVDEWDVVGGFPADRGWDLATLTGDGPGSSAAKEGGFLHDAAEFDPGFFGIAPREAIVMDPQQRLVLEVAWEAFERAGIDATGLRGGDTGVYIGGGSGDYTPPADTPGHQATAQAASLLSGRVSYALGLEGPSVSVDTACSSSLVALHLAAQALRAGECSLAVAGGVMVMSSPTGFVEFGEMGALSPDGRCKAFADAADGTGWSEGVGMIVLERESDARRHGHRILAVVRGSAVNSDGASNGLTAPSGPAQQRVIKRALAVSGLAPSEVDAVEAHGTGTKLGDPIEAQALLATYGRERERPLLLGSVKSNLGHTQAAAGAAAVIKMVLAMRHGLLPKTLHVDKPSEHVDWSAGRVALLTESQPWPETGHPRRAGISAFGASGTNAHLVLEQAPPADPRPAAAPATVPVRLSARTGEGLRVQARALRDHLVAHPELALPDIAFSAAATRAWFESRAVVVAGDREELLTGLGALTAGTPSPLVHTGKPTTGKLAFLFSGQGSQYPGMGRDLNARFPVFAAAFDEACAHLDLDLPGPLRDVVFGDDADLLAQTRWSQPAVFAVEVALYRLVESWGVRPDYLAGHSIGEFAAAHAAGVLSLADAARLVAARGRLMQELPAGAMAALQVTETEAEELISGRPLSIAAVNGPEAVVVSGDPDAVADVAGLVAARGRKTRHLRVSHAFHSSHMNAMRDEFERIAAGVQFAPPALPVVSTVTASPVTGELGTAAYWADHVRRPVLFAGAVAALDGLGVTKYLELGPDSTLAALTRTLTGESATVTAALRAGREDEPTLVSALARLDVGGTPVEWADLFDGARPVDLPTYRFHHERFWPDAPAAAVTPDFLSGLDADVLAKEIDVDRAALDAVLPALLDLQTRRAQQSTVDELRYRVTWKPLGGAPGAVPDGKWLVVVPAGFAEDPWVAGVVTALGAEVTGPETLTAALDGVTGVVSLLGLDESTPTAGAAATTALLQALAGTGSAARLWCLTRGAVTAVPSDRVASIAQAALWGLGRVAALEQPHRWGGLADLPADLDEHAFARLGAVLAGTEDQVAVRAAGAFARRLVRAPAGQPTRAWQPRGTVVVTGGTGALGKHVARWALAEGAARVVLTGRRGPDTPDAVALLADLGPRASVVACDLTDPAAVRDLLTPDVTAVIHAAGVLDDGVLEGYGPDRFDAVFAAKAESALVLDRVSRDLNLDVFALFSSASSSVGNAGQANYAAANAVLDAVAERRRADGLPGTSIAWGAWRAGMAETADAAARAQRTGTRPVAPELALAAFAQVVFAADAAPVVADIDHATFLRAFTAARPAPLLTDLPEYHRLTAEAPADAGVVLRERLGKLPAADREKAALDVVRTQVAAVLGFAGPHAVDPERPFSGLGFDSLSAIELRNQLAAATGLDLPATLVFDQPSPAVLAADLVRQLAPDTEDPDSELRALLAAVSPARLRESGVLDTLRRLAGPDPAGDEAADIDGMSVDDLVRAALDGEAT